MTSHLDLDALAAADAAPVPPVAQIRARAAALRRRRRRTTSVLSVGVVAAAIGVGGLVAPQGGATPEGPAAPVFLGVQSAAAADGRTGCNVGFGEALARDAWAADPAAARLPALLDAPGVAPLRGVSLHADTENCPPPVPVVTLYADDPVRGLTVYRDVADPYAGQDGLTERRVRGATAVVMTFDAGNMVLSWVDADGVRWLSQAGGITQDAAVALLDGLVLDPDGRLDPASVPADLVVGDVPEPVAGTRTVTYTVQYGSPGAEWTDDRVILSVSDRPRAAGEWAASAAPGLELVQVAGGVAEYDPGNDAFGQLIWTRDGLTYHLTGTGGVERLVELAESVRTVAPADPVIAAAPDLADVPDTGH